MGLAWNGVCYGDSASALLAFAKSVPSVDVAGVNTLSVPPTIDGAGVITWSIVNRSFSGASTTVAGTTQLPPCSDPGFDQWPVASWLLPVIFFFATVHGFKTGYRA